MAENISTLIRPFDGRNYRHREISYAPNALKQKKKNLYIVTDSPDQVAREFADMTDGVLQNLRRLSDDQISDSAFYIYFTRAELALPSLRRIVDCGGLFAPPPMFDKVPFHLVSAKAADTVNENIRIRNDVPFGGHELHSQICQAVELTKDLAGDFVEIGVYSGSSALTALTHMRNVGLKRKCWLFDTYEGFQYRAAAESSDMIWGGTHLMSKGPTIAHITSMMSETGQDVEVIPLEICSEDFPAGVGKISLANLDVDMYESIKISLNKLAPRMLHRGIIIVEDATSLPGLYGAYLAMNEFLGSPLGRDFMAVRTTTQYFLIRVQGHPV